MNTKTAEMVPLEPSRLSEACGCAACGLRFVQLAVSTACGLRFLSCAACGCAACGLQFVRLAACDFWLAVGGFYGL